MGWLAEQKRRTTQRAGDDFWVWWSPEFLSRWYSHQQRFRAKYPGTSIRILLLELQAKLNKILMYNDQHLGPSSIKEQTRNIVDYYQMKKFKYHKLSLFYTTVIQTNQ